MPRGPPCYMIVVSQEEHTDAMAPTGIASASLEDMLCRSLQNWNIQHVQYDSPPRPSNSLPWLTPKSGQNGREGRRDNRTREIVENVLEQSKRGVICVLYKRSSGISLSALYPKRQVLYFPCGPETKRSSAGDLSAPQQKRVRLFYCGAKRTRRLLPVSAHFDCCLSESCKLRQRLSCVPVTMPTWNPIKCYKRLNNSTST